MKDKILCQQCKGERLVDLSKSIKEKYMIEHPLCQKCRTLNAKDIISKTWFKKGISSWNKGIPSKLKKDNPGYEALHEWVERWAGKPNKCEKCECTEAKRFDWSNKSGKYLRDLSDWQRLCAKCHSRYDYEVFGARKAFYE